MAFRKFNIQMSKSEIVDFNDSLMVLGKENTSTTDIGFLGKIGSNVYTGLVRDSDDEKFYLIDSVSLASTYVDDVNPLNVSVGTIVANIETDSITVSDTFVAPKGTTAQRPASPSEGQIWFNTETKLFEGYDGTQWVQFIPSQFQSTP